MTEEIPQAQAALRALREALDDLRGAYLYGSATLGGLRPDSDVDVLALTGGPLSAGERGELTGRLLAASGRVGERGGRPLEVTVMTAAQAARPDARPMVEYQYGEWLRAELEAGALPRPGRSPDAAILLWQARAHSLTLCGPEARKAIAPVPDELVRQAIRGALPSLLEWLRGDERNVLLTLARMWYTLVTGEVCAKDEAAVWAQDGLSTAARAALELARAGYLGLRADSWSARADEARRAADELRARIESELAKDST